MRLNIRLDLTSEQVRLHLLQGLDSWVKLGLISDAQIREIAQTLSDTLPLPQADEATSLPPYVNRATNRAISHETDWATNRETALLATTEATPEFTPESELTPPAQPNRMTQALRGLTRRI